MWHDQQVKKIWDKIKASVDFKQQRWPFMIAERLAP
jgi:hypothetical protein